MEVYWNAAIQTAICVLFFFTFVCISLFVYRGAGDSGPSEAQLAMQVILWLP